MNTTEGEMQFEVFPDLAPEHAANFVALAQIGFYNDLEFHRVISGFVIQGGCPNTREGAVGHPGTGGPGYSIDCELTGENQYHDRGVLSMAHAGRNTGGSQFFVCHSRTQTAHLDGVHTVFGKVIEGLEVIDAIREGDSIDRIEMSEGA